MSKVYIDVLVLYAKEGDMIPLKIIWEDKTHPSNEHEMI